MAIVVAGDDFKSVADAEVWHEKSFEIVESVLSLSDDIKSQIDLYIWLGYHDRRLRITCYGLYF